MKIISVPGATIDYRNDGIIHITYEDKLLNLEEVSSIFKATRQNAIWEITPILATGGPFTNFEVDARAFIASEEVMKHCSAVAMVSKTLGEKILANFYIKFNNPSKPTKFFSNKEEALNWLKQFETVAKK